MLDKRLRALCTLEKSVRPTPFKRCGQRWTIVKAIGKNRGGKKYPRLVHAFSICLSTVKYMLLRPHQSCV